MRIVIGAMIEGLGWLLLVLKFLERSKAIGRGFWCRRNLGRNVHGRRGSSWLVRSACDGIQDTHLILCILCGDSSRPIR